jgi:hypothetical protein
VEAVDPDQVALVVHLHHLNIWDHVKSVKESRGEPAGSWGLGGAYAPSPHTHHTTHIKQARRATTRRVKRTDLIYTHHTTHIKQAKRATTRREKRTDLIYTHTQTHIEM